MTFIKVISDATWHFEMNENSMLDCIQCDMKRDSRRGDTYIDNKTGNLALNLVQGDAKTMGGTFNLPGHLVASLRVVVLLQRNLKGRLERETVELRLIIKIKTMHSPALN